MITLVIAHELGHIMGLNHETRRCATMNPSVAERCGKTPPCTILQADDVRGAIARYGGRARTRPRELCPLTPRDVRVQPLSSGYGMEVVVKNVPAADRVAARIARDQCPAKPGGDGASLARAAGSGGPRADQRVRDAPLPDRARRRSRQVGGPEVLPERLASGRLRPAQPEAGDAPLRRHRVPPAGAA